MSLKQETATVYRGGGRRWFSPMSAARAEAKKAIKSRCYCVNEDGASECCHYHEPGHYEVLRDRLARRYLRNMTRGEG